MLSFSLGPFALSMSHLLLIAALTVATFAEWMTTRRQPVKPPSAVFGVFISGLLMARFAFVLQYWAQYRGDPLRIVDIRDGGFSVWPGIAAVLVATAVLAWRRPMQRRGLAWGVASGLLFWWLANLAVDVHRADVRLPDLALRNDAGERVHLRDYTGRRLVINLWATWCPPCRREMPVLQAAQKANPDVVFLFVNQGESPREVAMFLRTQGLQLNNIVFDEHGELARHVGSAALPTTLFYDTDGAQLAGHLGELSGASLKRYIDGLKALPSSFSQSGITP